MHVVTLSRGLKADVDRTITELQGKYLPYKHKGKNLVLGMRVCPIQLWDISFPKQWLELMSITLFGEDKGRAIHKPLRKYLPWLQKLMKLKKLPPYKKQVPIPLYKQNSEFIPVGIKEDGEAWWGERI